jgi:SAM-dependent methyltransferase
VLAKAHPRCRTGWRKQFRYRSTAGAIAMRRYNPAMPSDVVDLRDFYRSPLGQVARRMIRRAVQRMWPDLRGMRLLGLGYATPFLAALAPDTERTIALMPAPLGVLRWPADGANLVALADEGELPFADYSIDRVLLIHGLETAEETRALLKEVWRVLAGGGRVLVVAPNRRGIWARLDHTPFGSGRPYTMSQLSRLLREEQFTPVGIDTALFIPPFTRRVLLRSAAAWERIGNRSFPTFAGVLLVEAAKQIYARPAAARLPRRRLVYAPGAAPIRPGAVGLGHEVAPSRDMLSGWLRSGR